MHQHGGQGMATKAAYIHLLDPAHFLPSLIDKRLIDHNSCGRHKTVETAQARNGLLKGSRQALFFRHIGLQILSLDPELFRKVLESINWLIPKI